MPCHPMTAWRGGRRDASAMAALGAQGLGTGRPRVGLPEGGLEVRGRRAPHGRVEAPRLANGGAEPGMRGPSLGEGLQQRLTLRQAGRQGLFHEDVLAGLQGLQAQGGGNNRKKQDKGRIGGQGGHDPPG